VNKDICVPIYKMNEVPRYTIGRVSPRTKHD
jgi:hypothetical protein